MEKQKNEPEPLGEKRLVEILEALGQVVASDLSVILDVEGSDRLRVRAARGSLVSDDLRNYRVDLRRRPAVAQALQGDEPILRTSEHEDEEPDTYENIIELPGDHSCLVVPLRVEGRLLGAMTLDSTKCGVFPPASVRAVKAFAHMASKVMAESDRVEALSSRVRALAAENMALRTDIQGQTLIGQSSVWKHVIELLSLVAPLSTTVLIQGETGTGKEEIARRIHALSARSKAPFIAVNCAVLLPELALSMLFGHERGAFTGADSRKIGFFEAAQGGTLFLDEIGELPPIAQAQLLRVLQDKWFQRVGGLQEIESDVRLIVASHKELTYEIADGRFREDLYFRLSTFPIELPPLREREGDLMLLTFHWLQRISEQLNMPDLSLSMECLDAIEDYDWPGNVRQLGNVLERAAIVARGQEIQRVHFQGTPLAPKQQNVPRVVEEALLRPQDVHSVGSCPSGYHLPSTLARLHRATAQEILYAIDEAKGKIGGKGGAAERLGVPVTTLHSAIRRFGLKI